MNTPTVSVIIPVYNQEKYLRENLLSVCGQTYRNLEIIVVDDGSTDSSPAIPEEFAARDGRIRVLTQKNRYAGVARNYGMQEAHGDYYLFPDSDDIFEPDMVERLVERAQQTGAEITVCRSDCFDTATGKHQPMSWAVKDALLKGVDTRLFCPATAIPRSVFQFLIGWTWDKLYRADFVRRHQFLFSATRHCNDAPFVFPTIAAAEKVSITDGAPLVHRRVSDTQISNGKGRSSDPTCWVESVQLIYDKIQMLNASEDVLYSFRTWLIDYIHWSLTGMTEEACHAVAEAVREVIEPKLGLADAALGLLCGKDTSTAMKKSCREYLLTAAPKIRSETLVRLKPVMRRELRLLRRKQLYYRLLAAITFGRVRNRYREKLNYVHRQCSRIRHLL